LKCSQCNCLHNELPDILTPYKRYTSEVIEDVVDGTISTDDLSTENYPCETTMKRWTDWIGRNVCLIDGLFKSGTSLLLSLIDEGAGWLGTILCAIYNSGRVLLA
jgi:hypothetical protein